MTKATVTILRQAKAEKPVASALGSSIISDAFVHFTADAYTIHARDAKLRRITGACMFPLETGNIAMGRGTANLLTIDKRFNNYASIAIFHIGTQATGGGSAKIVAGSAQNYYALVIGD